MPAYMRSSLPGNGGKQLAARRFKLPLYDFKSGKRALLMARPCYLDVVAADAC